MPQTLHTIMGTKSTRTHDQNPNSIESFDDSFYPVQKMNY